MRSKVITVVLLSACLASAQQIKQPKSTVPSIKDHSAVAPPPIVNTTSSSSAAQLAKIEQQTARVRAPKPVTHANTVAATPALDLGKNKPVRAARSPQPGLPGGH
jgi:type IV secretory pathway VirJ component